VGVGHTRRLDVRSRVHLLTDAIHELVALTSDGQWGVQVRRRRRFQPFVATSEAIEPNREFKMPDRANKFLRTLDKSLKFLAAALFLLGLGMIAVAILAPFVGMGIVDDFWGFRLFGIHRRPLAFLGARVSFWGLAALVALFACRPVLRFLYPRLSSWQFYVRSSLFTCKCFFSACVFVLCSYIVLTAYDRFLAVSASISPPGESALPGHDIELNQKSIRTLELYPFTGWHIQSNFAHRGPMSWELEPNKDYDVKTGPLGFFIDFDIENPPPKKAGEYRIILIGGSGAQGWGGQSNDKMLYRVLEKRLNESLARSGRSFKVINMAMASSITYQNYIALNRWGHALQPDLILSYSGRNDWMVPVKHEGFSDTHYQFNRLNALVYASRGCEYAPRFRWLSALFPNVMNRSNLGIALKLLVDYDDTLDRAKDGYRESRGVPSADMQAMFYTRVVPFYVHALKSIKRDYEGISVMVAWQALAPDEIAPGTAVLGVDFYNRMFEEAKEQLAGYINTRWYFLNVHQRFEHESRPTGIRGHLSDEGHVLVADLIAREIEAQVFGPLGAK
jgi:hypothetical protein